MKTSNSFPTNTLQRINIGWKMYTIGAFPVSCGGDNKFQLGMIRMEMLSLQKQKRKHSKNSKFKIQNWKLKTFARMKMWWTPGFPLGFGRFLFLIQNFLV